jgi:hypothetical protein
MRKHGETGRDAASSEGTVIVTETSVGGDTQQIAAGRHRCWRSSKMTSVAH